mgnify:FL=1
MTYEITPIKLALPMRMGNVNCYLIKTANGFILIDSGASNMRGVLDEKLAAAGCAAGTLRLIIFTHGDFDHTGNAAHLRKAYGTQLAMHRLDAGMGEHGDMFENRQAPNFLIRRMVPLFTGFGRAEHFSPDILLEEGQDLSRFGLDARVLSIPGHSAGSIGVLTAEGDLFCGDLFENNGKPVLNSIMDDLPSAEASMARLNTMGIHTVYPGHGDPFAYNVLL